MSLTIKTPPTARGSVTEQLDDIREYLFTLSRELNVGASDFGAAAVWEISARALSAGAGSGASDSLSRANAENMRALRDLILSATKQIAIDSEELRAAIMPHYVQKSAFNQYFAQATAEIEKKKVGIALLWSLCRGICADITKLKEGESAGIACGFLYTGTGSDGNSVPVSGIAIGDIASVYNSASDKRELDRTRAVCIFAEGRITLTNGAANVTLGGGTVSLGVEGANIKLTQDGMTLTVGEKVTDLPGWCAGIESRLKALEGAVG